MKLLKHNRRGYSLVEVLVTVAIVSMLILGLSAILANLFGYYNTVEKTSRAKSVADTTYTVIIEKLRFSNGVWLTSPPADAEKLVITPQSISHYKSDGSLEFDLTSEFFSVYSIKVNLAFDASKNLFKDFYIVVLDSNGEIAYQTEPVDIKPINFDYSGTTSPVAMNSFPSQEISILYFTWYQSA